MCTRARPPLASGSHVCMVRAVCTLVLLSWIKSSVLVTACPDVFIWARFERGGSWSREWFSTQHLPPQRNYLLFLRIKELSQWTWIDRCIRFLWRRYIRSGTPHHPNLFLEFWFHSKIEKVEISHMAPGPTYAQPVPYQNGTFVNTDKPTWIWSPRVHSLH